MKTIHALLVDDDANALETMSTILEMDEYQVSTATSGQKALEWLEGAEETASKVDFMVVDLNMANLSGIELLLEMRLRGHTLPVMVVTGFASRSTVVELLRQGVVDFLDKPVRVEEFRSRVHRIAKSVLKRRKETKNCRGVLPEPPDSARTPLHSASILDLSNLGIPYAFRRFIRAPESSLILACRKPHSYDILLADVGGSGAEAFYQSVLIRSFFDRHRKAVIDSRAFLDHLNQAVMDGALERPGVKALFLRVFTGERRLEILPAGYSSHWFLKPDAGRPRMLYFSGAPLGISRDPERTICECKFNYGDRLFICSGEAYAPAGADGASPSDGSMPARICESLAAQGGSVDEEVEGIWHGLLADPADGKGPDLFCLGMEFR